MCRSKERSHARLTFGYERQFAAGTLRDGDILQRGPIVQEQVSDAGEKSDHDQK
jgi:hypothetical protein